MVSVREHVFKISRSVSNQALLQSSCSKQTPPRAKSCCSSIRRGRLTVIARDSACSNDDSKITQSHFDSARQYVHPALTSLRGRCVLYHDSSELSLEISERFACLRSVEPASSRCRRWNHLNVGFNVAAAEFLRGSNFHRMSRVSRVDRGVEHGTRAVSSPSSSRTAPLSAY